MLKIKDIKKGDTFYECEMGFNDEFVATCDAHRHDGGWAVRGEPANGGDAIEFYVRDGFDCYAPRLYTSPMYM